jgi:hypothetical protein
MAEAMQCGDPAILTTCSPGFDKLEEREATIQKDEKRPRLELSSRLLTQAVQWPCQAQAYKHRPTYSLFVNMEEEEASKKKIQGI